ncbi:ABC transporter permease subunit [Campylobacter sputorum]|uniref:ABC transporter permease subunit n=1 Tax=Campylobacter sputorum TaxID=206 RepID=UPI00053BFD84|nr:ABC transporter permease subunit [Campylobacter sputorum]
MIKFITKRILYLFPLLFVVSIFIFALLRLNGTDAVLSYLVASSIAPTDEAIASAKAALGLDKSILVQYFIWIKQAIMLDFGSSFLTKRDVAIDMLYYLPSTLKLAAFALFLTLIISIPLGIISAIYKDSYFDYFTRIISYLGVCTPNFWLGLMLIVIFSVKLDLLPPFGIGTFSHMIMPAIAISFMSIAINIRLIRANMLENKNKRYIIYAKSRGLKNYQIYINYIFKISLFPIVTTLGMHIGELIGGALIIENIFAYPGIGRYAVNAISNNDYPVIQCFIIMMSFIFIILNLIIDILYAFIDPRVKKGMVEK